jgi:hypothetical protein
MHIKDVNKAKEAWKKLEDLYNPKGFTTDFLIIKEFFNTVPNNFETMELYLNKIKELVDNLKSKEIIIPDKITISWVLNALDNRYDGFISNVTQALRNDSNAYTVDTLFSSIIDESRGKTHDKVLFTNNPVKNGFKYKGKKPYKKQNKVMFCTYCKLPSHFEQDCWFLHTNKAPATWDANKVKKNNFNNPPRFIKAKTGEYGYKGKAFPTVKNKKRLINAIIDEIENNYTEKPVENNENVEEINVTSDDKLDWEEPETVRKSLINITPNNIIKPSETANQNKDLNDLSFIYNTFVNNNNNNNFILDSAATVHVISNKRLLTNYKPVFNKTVN